MAPSAQDNGDDVGSSSAEPARDNDVEPGRSGLPGRGNSISGGFIAKSSDTSLKTMLEEVKCSALMHTYYTNNIKVCGVQVIYAIDIHFPFQEWLVNDMLLKAYTHLRNGDSTP
ncbi:hypothetical protein PR202_gb00020 [Eleusine coracana subsp. coracana]|uniref:Uncharacterized protein n=1 Tax=Eleusine coracana subsp. coracana TaxID=191504 RepID=A0AAV5DSL8_ELECO|nr:hypothetical protein PR202_gb00020 [Eleusine coracana subsp. coracana]